MSIQQPETFNAGGLLWRRFPTAGESGTPLVILHGLFGSGDNWQNHARALADRRDVLIPDMPGHGASDHVASHAYPEIADHILAALTEIGFGTEAAPVSLLGHSMGGKAAMGVAFARPGAVERLIIADIAPREYPRRHIEIFDAMEDVVDGAPQSRSDGERIMAAKIPEKAVRLFLLKSLVPDGRGSYQWQLDLSGLRAGYDDIRGWPYPGGRYDGPTIVIAGGASPYVNTDDRDRIRAHFPHARVETIEDAGHWLHVEARDRFLAILRRELP